MGRAMGSVIVINLFLVLSEPYQLDFTTPGIIPVDARLRRQMRQIPNRRMYPRGRAHWLQQLYARVENLGLRFCLMINAIRATVCSSCLTCGTASRAP